MIATEYSGTNGKLFATKSPPAIPFDPIPQRSSSIDVNVIPAGGQQQRPLWAGTNHADRDRFSEDNSWKTAQDGLRNYGGGIKDTFLSFFFPNLFSWWINPHPLYSDRQRPPPYGEIKESYASEADRSVNPYYSPDINRHYVWVLFSFKIFWQREHIYYLSYFSIVVQSRMERARKKCEQRLPSRGSSLQRSILR